MSGNDGTVGLDFGNTMDNTSMRTSREMPDLRVNDQSSNGSIFERLIQTK